MAGQTIKNLPDPVDDGDAVSKNYLDRTRADRFFKRNQQGDYVQKENLKMDGKTIEGLPLPVDDTSATTKIYTDTLVTKTKRDLENNKPFTLQQDQFTAKDKINMRGFKIENVGFPDLPEDVATVEYVDEHAPFERKNGGFQAKDHIYIRNKKLGGLRTPQNAFEAANKQYVDQEIIKVKDNVINKFSDGVNYLADSNVNMQNFRLYGISDPQREDETANKKYVDEKTANINADGGGGGVDAAVLNDVKTELERNQAFNTRNGKTFNAKGNLNLKQKTIRNLPEPTEETDAATKGYVDEMKEFFEEKIKDLEKVNIGGGGNAANGAFGDMKGKKIINLGDPKNPQDGANKKYVDEIKINTPFLKDENEDVFKAIGNIDLQKLSNVGIPRNENDLITKGYVENVLNDVKDEIKEETIIKQDLDMKKFKVINAGNPEDPQDLVTKNYVDVKTFDHRNEGPFLKENGYYIATTGFNMAFKNIQNVPDPRDDNDAVPKSHVERVVKSEIKKMAKYLKKIIVC